LKPPAKTLVRNILLLLVCVSLFLLIAKARTDCRGEEDPLDETVAEQIHNVQSTPAPPDIALEVFGYDRDSANRNEKLYHHLCEKIDWGLTPRRPHVDEMILIPTGWTIVGDSAFAHEGRSLRRQRRLVQAFYIDRYEVSEADYNRCVVAGQCLPLIAHPHNDVGEKVYLPAIVTYKQAERYCLWAGKRLPTELEWETATRGREGARYCWGDDEPTDRHANICDRNCPYDWADQDWNDGFMFRAPPGRFRRGDSPFGVNQACGNLREWVSSELSAINHIYIARGASWYSDVNELMAFYRQVWKPGIRLDDKGVRCAADVPQ